MSSQKGNALRNRPQKHQNRFAFKNNLHDTNVRTKRLNSIQINHVCPRCKDILEWKIKYKKYKMLKAAKNCNKCQNKTVKEAYHTMCGPCAGSLGLCPKCGVPRNEWTKAGEKVMPEDDDDDDDDDENDDDDDNDNLENTADDSENKSNRDPSPS